MGPVGQNLSGWFYARHCCWYYQVRCSGFRRRLRLPACCAIRFLACSLMIQRQWSPLCCCCWRSAPPQDICPRAGPPRSMPLARCAANEHAELGRSVLDAHILSGKLETLGGFASARPKAWHSYSAVPCSVPSFHICVTTHSERIRFLQRVVGHNRSKPEGNSDASGLELRNQPAGDWRSFVRRV